jgi:hypothetical protein
MRTDKCMVVPWDLEVASCSGSWKPRLPKGRERSWGRWRASCVGLDPRAMEDRHFMKRSDMTITLFWKAGTGCV